MPVDRQLLREAEAVCVQAVHQAGAVLLEYFRQPLNIAFKEKGQQSPVTEADRHSEELLRTALTQTQLSIPVAAGRMALGTWQGIYLFEHRRDPPCREIALHLIGK